MGKTNFSITRLVVGQLSANCYIVAGKRGEAVIVDPGDDAQYIAEHLRTLGLTPKAIIATHGHFDHILAAWELKELFHIPFLIHKEDTFLVSRMRETALHFLGKHVVEQAPAIDGYLEDKMKFPVGSSTLVILHTPGHTPGSISVSLSDRSLLVGDTIFADGAVGRTDFSYSKPDELDRSIRMILSGFPETVLYPGHGDQTSVEKELRYHTI